MNIAPQLAIIILSWDSIPDTLACLQAALRSDYPALHVLIVDNANQRKLAELLERDYPVVHLLQNQTNLGYAAGNNVGIQWALDQGADYILLLNDDICIEPDTCQNLVTAALDHPGTASVGGKIRPEGDPKMLWAAGEAFPRQNPLVRDEGQFDSPRPVRYAVGSCMLLSRNALQTVGLFDEAFFMVHEEKEWCYRANRAGFQNWYTPDAIAWHHLDQAFNKLQSPAYHYLYVRNNLYFWQRLGQLKAGGSGLPRAIQVWWQEVVFIRRGGKKKLRSTWAAGLGALDYLRGRSGAPPGEL